MRTYTHTLVYVCIDAGASFNSLKNPAFPTRKRGLDRDALGDLNGHGIIADVIIAAAKRWKRHVDPVRVIRPFYDEEIAPTTVNHEYLSASRTAPAVWPRKSTPALIRTGSAGSGHCMRCYYRLPSNQRYNVELMHCFGSNGIMNGGYAW